MRTAYKLGQVIETNDHFGPIAEIRTKIDGTTEYVLSDENIVKEEEVLAVYRKVTPRKAVKTTTRNTKTTSKKSRTENEKAAA